MPIFFLFSSSIPMKYYSLQTAYPFYVVVEPENKLCFLTTVDLVHNYEKKYQREGKMSVKLLDEELRSEFVVFSITTFSPFFEEFSNIFQRLLESGFKSNSFKISVEKFKSQHESIDSVVPALVLNMYDLEIGFLVCLIPFSFSVIAFVCELLWTRRNALRDLLTILCLSRAFAKAMVGLRRV